MNRLYHGDCLELMQDIKEKSIDMILCDLPYGTTACKWDVIISFEHLWEEYKRIIKYRGCIALFGSEPFSSSLRLSNIKQFKYDWIWNKVTASGMQIAKYRPMNQHEIISVFSNGSIIYFPIMEKMDKPDTYKCYTKSESFPLFKNDGITRIRTHKYPKSILTYSNANKKGNFHPTQKPVALLEYLIKTYTLEGETVLDNCMGSGSTGVACININRDFIGIEKEKKYFDIAEKRINNSIRDKESKLVFDE
jgi:site-specific DNA-methyltransferase (adenine-specific)